MAYHLSKKRRKKSIKLATTKDIALVLMVADQKGFFHDHGLRIEFVYVPYANKGTELLLAGKVNISSIVETNFAYLGYLKPKNPVKCFVSLEKRSADNILIRSKNATPDDLAGKIIGFMPRTTSHSFLMQFLEQHTVSKQNITLKPFTPQAMPDAFIRGEVDAVSLWEPYASNTMLAMDELGLDYTHFENFGFYTSEVVLGTSKTFLIKQRPDVENILKALQDAEKFLRENPDTAHQILAQKMNLPEPKIKNILNRFQSALSPINPAYLENIQILSDWIGENDTEFMNHSPSNYLDFIDNSIFLDINKET